MYRTFRRGVSVGRVRYSDRVRLGCLSGRSRAGLVLARRQEHRLLPAKRREWRFRSSLLEGVARFLYAETCVASCGEWSWYQMIRESWAFGRSSHDGTRA